MATNPKRLCKEPLNLSRYCQQNYFVELDNVEESNMARWFVIIHPETVPYDLGKYIVKIVFPYLYPIEPPSLVFETQFYHPNVAQSGEVDARFLRAEYWKQETTTIQIINYLFALIDEPDLLKSLRADVSQEYQCNRPILIQKARDEVLFYLQFPNSRNCCQMNAIKGLMMVVFGI